MSKEELVAFLKEHLEVRVDVSRRYNYDSSGVRVEVELFLEGELISGSVDSTYLD